MILCLDTGNTHIFGGVFDEDENILLRFRCETSVSNTSDQLGVFFKQVLKENHIDAQKIQKIAISSVIPSLDYSLRSACIKYFNIEPFILNSDVKMLIQIKIDKPQELGADLIAGAIGAVKQHSDKNIIVVDFGTATTFAVINKAHEYLGTIILPGVRLSMEALGSKAAKLFSVEIIKPKELVGRNTTSSIQSGLYYSQPGVIKELTSRIKQETFQDDSTIVLGTGGFAHMFEQEHLFDVIEPDLVLSGLLIALKNNS